LGLRGVRIRKNLGGLLQVSIAQEWAHGKGNSQGDDDEQRPI